MAAGQRVEAGGDFLQGLLTLILEQQRTELHRDGFLPGVGIERVAAAGVRVRGGAGLLEQRDDAGDFLLAQLVQHAADGLEHDYVVAFEAVALVFLDHCAELRADAAGGGLDLLLPQLLLEELVTAGCKVSADGRRGASDGGNRQREEGFAVHSLNEVYQTLKQARRERRHVKQTPDGGNGIQEVTKVSNGLG